MGKSKAIHVAISGILAAALVFSGCGKKEKPVVEEKTLSVDLQTAKKGELVLAETYVGTASAQEEVTVYPTASGEVLQVNVSLGDHVTAGQQLFKIDDESARLSLKSAQAGYASQQAQMNQTLGGQMELNQQQEQQGIAGNERSADSSSRALEEAEENIERGQRAIEDAQKDVEDARDKYDEAVEKYHSAKSYLDDWEDLKEEESAFSSLNSVAEAAAKKPDATTGLPTQAHIDEAKSLLEDITEDGLTASQVTTSGVEQLETAKDTAHTTLLNKQRAVETARDNKTDFQRQAEKARDSLESADAALESSVANQQLTDGRVLEDTRKTLEAGLASSAVGIEQAQYALDQYVTKAPITGVVEKLDVHTHDVVGPNVATMIISNKDSMKIEFFVPETVRDNLTVGQTVRVKKDGAKYRGAITEVSEMLDPDKGLFAVTAVVSGDEGILNGSTVTVKVDSYRDDGGIVIPYDAVYYANGKPYIYVVKGGKAVKRDVATGLFDEKNIVITKGLSKGEQVITSWSADLRDGAQVRDAKASNGDKAKPGAEDKASETKAKPGAEDKASETKAKPGAEDKASETKAEPGAGDKTSEQKTSPGGTDGKEGD